MSLFEDQTLIYGAVYRLEIKIELCLKRKGRIKSNLALRILKKVMNKILWNTEVNGIAI